MKKAFTIIMLLASLLLFMQCGGILDPQGHEIRAKNKTSQTINFKIGSIKFSNVKAGTTTGYKDIDEGTHKLTGDLTGSLTVQGSGHHKWTLTINSDGSTSIKED